MAACILGASGLTIPSLNLVSARRKFSTRQPFHGFQIRIPEYSPWDGLQMAVRPKRAYLGCQFSASEVTANLDDPPKESNDSRIPSRVGKFILKSTEVEALVTEICDTSIAEFELKLGGFRLYLMRGLNQQVAPVPIPVTAPVSVDTATEVPNANGSASSASLAITKLGSSSRNLESLLAKAVDEGLVILQSPKVGYFRSSRTIKGKRAPPSCKEKQQVNEGQVLCYIEQLGGEIPIESDVSGEVIKILRKDGEPVGYGDALIAMLPEFPGIKKL